MTESRRCFGIIPARYGSSRFPGKPLADICGKPMFRHVYDRARQCPDITAVYLATDDERIAEAAVKFDVPFIETRSDHISGTDRVFEAAGRLHLDAEDLVINIQGDEPLLNPLLLSELIRPFDNPKVLVTTPVRPVDRETARRPDLVKAVFSVDHRALYFSRAPIPFPRESEPAGFYGHIGLYAFRMAVLARFVALPPGRLEEVEKLEQLRLLENNIPIHVVCTDYESTGVDRPEDLEVVRAFLCDRQE